MKIFSIHLAKRVITTETALLFVLLIVRRIDTQMVPILARRGGWVQAVQQVNSVRSVIDTLSIFDEMILILVGKIKFM